MNMTNKEIRLHNLQRLIEHSGLSKTAFAVKVNTSPAYISQMLSSKNRRSMGNRLARSIEAAFNKDAGWMDVAHRTEDFQEKGVRKPRIESNVAWFGGLDVVDDELALSDDEVNVPFIKEFDMPGGPGRTEVGEFLLQKQRFAKSTLKKSGVPVLAAYCLIITGDSMEPVLPDGATLAIDSSRCAIRDGELYAIDHAGVLRVRVLYKMPGGGLRLRSYNDAEWPDENYTPEEARAIKVLGRVFWWEVLR